MEIFPLPGPAANNFDPIRLRQAVAALQLDVRRLFVSAGLADATSDSPLPSILLPLLALRSGTTSDGPITPAESDGSFDLGPSAQFPAGALTVGSLLRVDFCVTATVLGAGWTVRPVLTSSGGTGGGALPAADAITIAAAGTIILNVRFQGTFRSNGSGGLVVVPDSFALATTAGTTVASANTDFSASTVIDPAATLTIVPALEITGSSVGDTVQLLSMEAELIGPSTNVG